MWQRFTDNARKTVFYAQEVAGEAGQNFVGPEHLLLAMLHSNANAKRRSLEEPNTATVVLQRLGVDVAALYKETVATCSRGSGRSGKDMQLTPEAKRVIDLAYDEAKQFKHTHIGTEHLLLGLLREVQGIEAAVLNRFGVTLDAVRLKLPALLADKAASKEQLLSLDEAVKFLGTSRPTLYRLLGQDEIKGLKVGRQWRFRKADLVAYMERGPVAVSAAPTEDLDRELLFFTEQLGQSADLTGDPEAKTVRLVHQIITLAIHSKASDIHWEPTPEDLLLRLRMDGRLHETRRLPSSMKESLTAQIKTMAEMEVNEKRLPQEGRIPVVEGSKNYDFRVASLPSVYGEAITMRILAKQDLLLGLDKLGLTPEDAQQVRRLMQQPSGIVLVAGPAGSGKTTLLYSCLQEVAGAERRTLTVEDPVEYPMPYLTQTQVNLKSGLTFAAALRAFLRQDPDVVFVSELRDLETAQIAVEVSLAGHLLLSSLSTADASSVLVRLLDQGLEPHLISATLSGVIATRLVRRVCEHCRQPVDLSAEPALSYIARLAAEGGFIIPEDAVFVRGAGCEQCRGRGYLGRTGLYEILTMTPALTEAVLRRAPADALRDIAIEEGGMRTLLADGIRKAAAGETTIKEVLRVVSSPA